MKLLNTALIERAGENGYPFYRIPGIVATEKGTLLTCYEARHGGDWAVIDLYVRRSTDGGHTWEARQMVLSGQKKNTTNNPVMIVDGERVHLLCLENYKRLFHRVSEDDGLTWSEPEEITDALEARRAEYPWTCAAVGPGHGLRLPGGRLIAAVWLASNPGNITAHGPSKISTLYSDDHGKTWTLGEIFEPEGSVSPNETCVAALSDGRVILNIRSRKPDGAPYTAPHYRYIAISADGAGNWNETWLEKQLPDPACCGGMCNFPGGLLFTNCDSYISRSNHTLRKSTDDGRTWSEALLYDPLAGYSDCIYNPATGTAFVAYEHERESELRVSEIEL